MKTLISMIASIGLALGIVSTASATGNQQTSIQPTTDVVANFGSQVMQNQTILQKEVLDALVEPYLEQIENRSGKDGKQEYLNVWIIADDGKGYKVFYNQHNHKFGLAKYVKDSKPFTSDNLRVQNELTKLFLASNS